jgi:hypothetical protein
MQTGGQNTSPGVSINYFLFQNNPALWGKEKQLREGAKH